MPMGVGMGICYMLLFRSFVVYGIHLKQNEHDSLLIYLYLSSTRLTCATEQRSKK